jgi:transcriptional regulator with XRE-family HTH domain
MPTRIRTQLSIDAVRANREQLVRLGNDVHAARVRRRWTQRRLGQGVGLSQPAVSRAERGLGGGLTLDAWQRIGIALGIPLRVQLQRDPAPEPVDAGHLRIQEMILRLGRAAGYRGLFELPTRPSDPSRSIDVGLADDARRRLIIVECWNVIGDVGSAARSSARKLAEADALATLRWAGSDHTLGLVWVIAATKRNRDLVARYPEVFASRFPGSSRGWAEALTNGAEPAGEPGLVWASVDGTRIWPWRRR